MERRGGVQGPGVKWGKGCIVGCRVGADVNRAGGFGGRSSLASEDARRRRASQLVIYKDSNLFTKFRLLRPAR